MTTVTQMVLELPLGRQTFSLNAAPGNGVAKRRHTFKGLDGAFALAGGAGAGLGETLTERTHTVEL